MAWYSESARRILPRPNPTPAGDKPLASRSLRPRYIFSFRPRPPVYKSALFRPLRAGIEVDWRAHPGSESGTCFRTNDAVAWACRAPPRAIRESPLQLGWWDVSWRCWAGRETRVCHAPPRVPTRDTPTVVLAISETPVGITGRAGPRLGTSAGATFSHSAIGHRSTIRHVSPVESRHRG